MTAEQGRDNYTPMAAAGAGDRLIDPPSLDYLNNVRGGPSADLFRDATIVHATSHVELLSLVRRIAVALEKINSEVSAIAVSVATTP